MACTTTPSSLSLVTSAPSNLQILAAKVSNFFLPAQFQSQRNTLRCQLVNTCPLHSMGFQVFSGCVHTLFQTMKLGHFGPCSTQLLGPHPKQLHHREAITQVALGKAQYTKAIIRVQQLHRTDQALHFIENHMMLLRPEDEPEGKFPNSQSSATLGSNKKTAPGERSGRSSPVPLESSSRLLIPVSNLKRTRIDGSLHE